MVRADVHRAHKALVKQRTSFCSVRRSLADVQTLFLIRAGATLLTRWERLLYFAVVAATLALAVVGAARSVAFYGAVLAAALPGEGCAADDL